MKAAIFLRIASVLALVHGILHTVGGVFGSPAPGEEQLAVSAMQSHRFQVMGLTRTFWDFYIGFGLFVSVNFFLQAVLFWQLASLAKAHSTAVRPLAVTLGVGYVAFAVLAWKYFFLPPVVFELIIAGCLAAAAVTANLGRAAPGVGMYPSV